MATTFQWVAPEALTTALTTELNALANSTSDTTGFSALSAEINNESGLFQYIMFELFLATQTARSAGAFVTIFMSQAVDNAPTYPDDSNLAFADPLATFQFDAAVTARRRTKWGIAIPPSKIKLYVFNKTGQAFGATTNTLKYRRHNEQGV